MLNLWKKEYWTKKTNIRTQEGCWKILPKFAFIISIVKLYGNTCYYISHGTDHIYDNMYCFPRKLLSFEMNYIEVELAHVQTSPAFLFSIFFIDPLRRPTHGPVVITIYTRGVRTPVRPHFSKSSKPSKTNLYCCGLADGITDDSCLPFIYGSRYNKSKKSEYVQLPSSQETLRQLCMRSIKFLRPSKNWTCQQFTVSHEGEISNNIFILKYIAYKIIQNLLSV